MLGVKHLQRVCSHGLVVCCFIFGVWILSWMKQKTPAEGCLLTNTSAWTRQEFYFNYIQGNERPGIVEREQSGSRGASTWRWVLEPVGFLGPCLRGNGVSLQGKCRREQPDAMGPRDAEHSLGARGLARLLLGMEIRKGWHTYMQLKAFWHLKPTKSG